MRFKLYLTPEGKGLTSTLCCQTSYLAGIFWQKNTGAKTSLNKEMMADMQVDLALQVGTVAPEPVSNC